MKQTLNVVSPLIDLNTIPLSDNKPAEKKSLFDSPIDFIKQLYPVAKKSAEALGINPKILLAQAALETGWGKYVMHSGEGEASHNLFGIKSNKSWSGDTVAIDTLEVAKGEFKTTKAVFKMYQSFEKSFEDYVDLIKNNPRYQQAVEGVGDATEYLSSLQSAGYATDPNYAQKILSIFKRDIIQQADKFVQ
ncbi:MAG: glucosaminidase domain-containing protein [Enterobacterales bacterium]|nr:glucosaminidase domain-containing protein [Enterobacterales bacterium]